MSPFFNFVRLSFVFPRRWDEQRSRRSSLAGIVCSRILPHSCTSRRDSHWSDFRPLLGMRAYMYADPNRYVAVASLTFRSRRRHCRSSFSSSSAATERYRPCNPPSRTLLYISLRIRACLLCVCAHARVYMCVCTARWYIRVPAAKFTFLQPNEVIGRITTLD